MKRRLVAVLVVIGMLSTMLVGCSSSEGTNESTETKAEEPGSQAEAETEDDKYIAMIALGFSHQYWQAVKQGAEEAADELGYRITFEGPEQETGRYAENSDSEQSGRYLYGSH